MTTLVIVESPNKVRSIAGYLGDGYVVDSSVGHIRDLPDTKRNPVPAKYKGESWARLGVDYDDGFTPHYFVPTDKKSQISKLKKLLSGVDELILATDEDREGEAIAWHLYDELKPKIPVKRIVFNEITKGAILAAMENPRDIDMDLVDAQETRRILDRIYGFEVSPVLWRKIGQGTSAGRVQSVALRLVVERERARMAFRSASYWDLTAILASQSGDGTQAFEAALVAVDGQKLATGKSFDDTGALTGQGVIALDQARAEALAEAAEGQSVTVASVEAKPYTRNPVPPFRTTTMQQDASRKWGWSASRTMQVAQRLYEGGYITYMRTDSITLSQTALKAAGQAVRELYGAEYHREQQYASKVKNAQEAHEAIRPAGETFRTPDQASLSGDEAKLYRRIWKRTVASQMMPAKGETVSARFALTAGTGERLEFAASGTTITFKGWLKAYSEATEVVEDAEAEEKSETLPPLTEGQSLDLAGIVAEGHDTKPPARYTEATLIAELEKREIGRPSTYASIMSTLLNRGYVWKKGTALVPAWIAFNIVRLLEAHFSRLVDYGFTAELEQVLDDIANGREDRIPVLESFWTGEGPGNTGLKRLLDNLPDIDARSMATFAVGEDPDTGHVINVRVGKYGPYLEGPPLLPGDGGEVVPTRANIPEDMPPDEMTLERAKELLANPAGQDKILGTHPETGLDLVAKNGRFGPYVTEVLPEDAPKSARPRTASLFKTMTLDSIGLEDAMKLLTLPRVVGTDVDGAEITAQNGRYGPYLKKGTDSRSLESEEQLLTLTEEEARAIYAQPKTYGRRTAAAPLKELGADPVSGKNIVVKDGRFGLYVTDGETNASLRKADSLETLTPERAHELLAERRARGPVKRTTKRTAKKTPAKKSAAKKSSAKKTAAKNPPRQISAGGTPTD
ncbi:MAG TPA: type I DNA topoisomerase [Aeromicrobium sp.]|nr:type I DNA topoisomerase [Aeromicrobium sp.]